MVVPLFAFISMYAAVIGAEASGHRGGSWGWGFILAVSGGLILGVIFSGIASAMFKKKRFTFLPVLLSAFGVSAIIFVIFIYITRSAWLCFLNQCGALK